MESAFSALVVDDDAGVRQSLRLCLEVDGARCLGVGTGAAALEALQRTAFDVVFLDLWLGSESGLTLLPEILRQRPGIGVVVVTAFATFETAVEAMRLGASDYLPKPFSPDQVRRAAMRIVSANDLRARHESLQQQVVDEGAESLFHSRSPSYRRLLDTAARAAASESVVLLRGESGTGKNLLAKWVHTSSRRASGPFVVVHCPALSGELMTSSLFGHRRGAFTGAVSDVVGKVEEAAGGTLFLDEIGDLSADAQARLLRFLNDRSYERLGEPRSRQADVRVVAATNRALEEDIAAGRFREDLLHRLEVITLTLPPLRERSEDVLPLALHQLRFIERSQGRSGLKLSPAAELALHAHTWPGNLRELRNRIQRAVVLGPSPTIDPSDLGLESSDLDTAKSDLQLGSAASIETIEREHIARVLASSSSLEAASRTLGIDPTTLQRKRKRYGLA